MRAFVKSERTSGAVHMLEVVKPPVLPGHVLVRVKAAAICGSDLHAYEYHKGYDFITVPVILGHEYSGVIEKVGQGVTSFSIGDRVVGESVKYCGHCANCHQGNTQICETKQTLGLHCDGGLAEYICVPEKMVHRLPDNISFEEGAVVEPCSVSLHAVLDFSGIRPGDLAVIIGPGVIGLTAAMCAKLMGAREVVVIGANADEESRLPLAVRLGFPVINVEQDDVRLKLLEISGESTVDAVIECSGSVAALDLAFGLVKKGRAVTALGMPSRTLEVFLPTLIRNETQLRTSYASAWTHYEKVLQLMSAGMIDVKSMITAYPFEEGIKAFEDGLKKKAIKPVVLI